MIKLKRTEVTNGKANTVEEPYRLWDRFLIWDTTISPNLQVLFKGKINVTLFKRTYAIIQFTAF